MANSNEPDSVNSGALAMIIAIVAFVTLAIALVVTALVRQETRELGGKSFDKQDGPYRNGKNEQVTGLSASPTWADKAKGLIAVPIERAIELTLAAVRKNPGALTPGVAPVGLGGAGAGGAGPLEDAKEEKKKVDEGEAKKPAVAPGATPAPISSATPAAPAPSSPAPKAP
jgi:hypothetical protein